MIGPTTLLFMLFLMMGLYSLILFWPLLAKAKNLKNPKQSKLVLSQRNFKNLRSK